jgi:hypothetical protein
MYATCFFLGCARQFSRGLRSCFKYRIHATPKLGELTLSITAGVTWGFWDFPFFSFFRVLISCCGWRRHVSHAKRQWQFFLDWFHTIDGGRWRNPRHPFKKRSFIVNLLACFLKSESLFECYFWTNVRDVLANSGNGFRFIDALEILLMLLSKDEVTSRGLTQPSPIFLVRIKLEANSYAIERFSACSIPIFRIICMSWLSSFRKPLSCLHEVRLLSSPIFDCSFAQITPL